MEETKIINSEAIQLWDSRAAALKVVDDVSRSEAVALATMAAKYAQDGGVDGQQTYDSMVLVGSVLAKIEKRLNDWHKVRTEAAFSAHKRAVADQKEEVGPIAEAKILAGQKVRDWEKAQEDIRRAEEARLAEIARKAQEEEALATAAQLRRQMEASGATTEQIAEVEEEVIQEVITRPLPAPIAAPTYAKSTAARKPQILWSARVTSLKELCAAIGRGDQPEGYALGLTKDVNGVISSPNLNAAAKAQAQVKLNIPGVVGVSKESKAGFSTR